MKKIYPIKERLFFMSTVLLLSPISIILFVNYNSKNIFVFIACTCILFIMVALLKLLPLASHIMINGNIMEVYDFPVLATNKFFVGKKDLILWNRQIDTSEIKKIELIKLTKEEKKNYIGYNHLCNKYLKINLISGNPKYVYVGNYSNSQIKNIIDIAIN